MCSLANRVSVFSFTTERNSQFPRLFRVVLFMLMIFLSAKVNAQPLSLRVKQFTKALSIRNLDSLRLFIDPNKIYVEIAPKEGSYLSPSQTLGVVESFFQSHPPVSFSYGLVKEQGKTGIAIGTLIVSENGRTSSYKVNFGFQKEGRADWLLSRVSIH